MDKLSNKIFGKLYWIKGYPDKKSNSILYISSLLSNLDGLIFTAVLNLRKGNFSFFSFSSFLSSNEIFLFIILLLMYIGPSLLLFLFTKFEKTFSC